jgi:L-threonylcarbamoyladenylate synthase
VSRIVTCNPARPDEKAIAVIAEALTDGQVVVMPTETQYALAVRADRDDAGQTIRNIKKRSDDATPALFVKTIEDAEKFCLLSLAARKLAGRFLPGPLTMVVPAKPGQQVIPEDFVSTHGIGLRVSSSPLIRAVMARVRFPVTATSANISGDITPRTVDKIRETLGDSVDLFIDGGPCGGIIPSTVVHVNEAVSLLRHGVIAETEIRAAAGGETA